MKADQQRGIEGDVNVEPGCLFTVFIMIFVFVLACGVGRITESIRDIEPADCTCICETAMESTP